MLETGMLVCSDCSLLNLAETDRETLLCAQLESLR
jgi:hypothetical protein